jgi:hypothetical protein
MFGRRCTIQTARYFLQWGLIELFFVVIRRYYEVTTRGLVESSSARLSRSPMLVLVVLSTCLTFRGPNLVEVCSDCFHSRELHLTDGHGSRPVR